MGSQALAMRGGNGSGRGRRLVLPFLGALVALLAVVPAAEASFHLMKVREVYPAGDASYVELQMTSAGEYLVAGHHLVSYNSDGSVADNFILPSNVAVGSPNNATILIGDSGYPAAFPTGPGRDESDSNLNLSAAGGAVCWTDGSPPDCVAWGNFTGPLPTQVPPLVVGSPASPAGVTAGKALRRSISPGCATFLEEGDDTDSSVADFSEQPPNPRNNNSAVTETPCIAPTTTIDTKPANPTKATSASFTYHSTPPGATFECKLDAGAFASCEASGASYPGPLGGGSHTFQVRANNANGTGPAASYTWTVDLTPPTVTIDTKPADPSPGTSAAFTFHSSESGSFQCSIEGPKTESFASCASGKTYNALANGTYTFNVRATDVVLNQGSATSYTWTVDNSLVDTTAPETSITSHPPDPSESANASFSFASNEANSTFECKLDAGPFTSCPASGVSYGGLGIGPHAFQVRAIDASHNVDLTPAGYSFNVVLVAAPIAPPGPRRPSAAPNTTISPKPPAKTHDRTPTLRFKSDLSGSTFACKVDGGPFKSCRSPFTTKSLSFGRHTVKVRASAAGVADPTPANVSFKVLRG